jgi:hypothetical protein
MRLDVTTQRHGSLTAGRVLTAHVRDDGCPDEYGGLVGHRLDARSVPATSSRPVRSYRGPYGFAARSFANSSPGFHAGNASPFAMRSPVTKSSCTSSTAPDRSQLGSNSSEGWW